MSKNLKTRVPRGRNSNRRNTLNYVEEQYNYCHPVKSAMILILTGRKRILFIKTRNSTFIQKSYKIVSITQLICIVVHPVVRQIWSPFDQNYQISIICVHGCISIRKHYYSLKMILFKSENGIVQRLSSNSLLLVRQNYNCIPHQFTIPSRGGDPPNDRVHKIQ